MIALVDCNNFYCSCERVFQPELAGRPLIVLSNNDGCIVARSNEVKAMGIAMGSPLFKVRDLVRRHQIVVRSSNYSLYGDMSQRVMRTLEPLSPIVEAYSIDEAFVHLDGLKVDIMEHARLLRRTVLQHTGIPVSVGIGPTKTLAKAASKLAKSDPRHEGIFSVADPAARDVALERLAAKDIWGVGPRYVRMLAREGIVTARSLRDADLAWVRQKMTIGGMRTVLELRGQRCFHAEMEPPPSQQIVRSRSFGRAVESLEDLEQAVAMHTSRAAEKLRGQHLAAGLASVFITTNRFKSDSPQYGNSITVKPAIPTDATNTLIACTLRGLRRIYRSGYAYKKAGVMLMDLTSATDAPQSLFAELQSPQSSSLDPTLDAVNRRFGPNTLRYAAVGFDHPWAMRRQFCSPRYTTCWNELPAVKVRV